MFLGRTRRHKWTCHPCREKGLQSNASLNVPLSSPWLWRTFAFYTRVLFEWNAFNFAACLCLYFGIQVCLDIESENKAATERGNERRPLFQSLHHMSPLRLSSWRPEFPESFSPILTLRLSPFTSPSTISHALSHILVALSHSLCAAAAFARLCFSFKT